MWKKLSCLLLCIAMLAGLAGCGKAAPTPEDPREKPWTK